MTRTALVTLLVVALLASGCRSPHGKLIAEYQPGDRPTVGKAPRPATYALVAADGNVGQQITVRTLDEDWPVGFREGTSGDLIAVAGRTEVPLGDGAYSWHVVPDSERGGMNPTVKKILIGTGVVVGVVVVAGVVLFVIAMKNFAPMPGP
jgi:hypothetical protein